MLAAALVEGALVLIVHHARALPAAGDGAIGYFRSSDYDKPPQSWKLDDLVRSAASGPSPILDPQVRSRAETLIRSRRRIHAGRMLTEFKAGPPDIRPEEARDALAIADQVVRAVIDWLQINPPAG